MGSPDSQGPRLPKPHPACPGSRTCDIPGCIHNASSRFSTHDGISLALFGANGMHGAYPSIRLFAGGWLYQRPDASTASERMNIGGVHVEAKNATISNTAYLAPTKFREVSGIVLARIRCWLNSEMPV